MKPAHAFIILAILVGSAVLASIDGLWRAGEKARRDVERALAMTMQRHRCDVIDTDTIRDYRRNLTMTALRDTAYLSMAVVPGDERRQPVVTAHTGLTLTGLWRLSDQRASGMLTLLAALWLACSLMVIRRQRRLEAMAVVAAATSIADAVADSRVRLGALCYDAADGRFSVGDRQVRFTPMQRELMQMFMTAPDHCLLQQDICERLWPKKPDATATLHTLIRRLKPLVEADGGLHIECERGHSYRLC